MRNEKGVSIMQTGRFHGLILIDMGSLEEKRKNQVRKARPQPHSNRISNTQSNLWVKRREHVRARVVLDAPLQGV